jgi:hypothetical protein
MHVGLKRIVSLQLAHYVQNIRLIECLERVQNYGITGFLSRNNHVNLFFVNKVKVDTYSMVRQETRTNEIYAFLHITLHGILDIRLYHTIGYNLYFFFKVQLGG